MSGTHDIEKIISDSEDGAKEEIKNEMLRQIGIQKANFIIAKDRNEYMQMALTMDRMKIINDLMYHCGIIKFLERDNIHHSILEFQNE